MSKSPAKPFVFVLLVGLTLGHTTLAEQLEVTPFKKSAIYELGEGAGWRIETTNRKIERAGDYRYTIKKNNFEVIKSGKLELSSGIATVDVRIDEPAMLFLEITPPAVENKTARQLVAGAAIAPTSLKPCAPRPADFDSFWESKIKQLHEIPENPNLTPKHSGRPDVECAIVQIDHINGAHVHGQIAKPKRAGKFPAVVIFQWASPPYPLQKEWVTDRAAEGWLALNIEPHDVLPDEPPSYYEALPDSLKRYESIGNNDRDKCYFLQMYLADYRAVDYIAKHPDWDGKTLVVMGISMGGQQSLCVAGLHPKVTHVIANVPAGCDTNGPLHGRQPSYPNFPANDPKVMQTALYFDAVNFAPRIKATSLVAMGFVDTTSAPAGIWTMYNQIPGPKEAVPMIDSPHNHLATPDQQRPYSERSAEWLSTLVKGGRVQPLGVANNAGNKRPRVDDHQNMMDQLGIKALRPGANPRDQSVFEEASATRYKDSMPDALEMKDGSKVKDARQWAKRRAEIVEDFEREIYGRIPGNVPAVAWEVTDQKQAEAGRIPTITKNLVGRVDNRACPEISVQIRATLIVPAAGNEPVPTMIAFSWPSNRGFRRSVSDDKKNSPPWTEQAIANGWGYVLLDPNSIQPDNAESLRRGIIGLTNRGAPREPDQWGALRAWQWGASRLIDYFAANPGCKVDAKKIGIEGLSRFGKAAIVTLAFDERVAVGLIGSSGAGGVKLYRHIYGETVENLAGGEFYWMAGNFMKYAAADAKFGSMTAADLPVDSHELIALCAPRLCFISYGTVEGGDPPWVDARGSFMAGVLASPVYRLLGKKGFGTDADYMTQPMPAVGKLVGGELAWRQHEGGHDVTPNWPTFFTWVEKSIKSPPKNGFASGSKEKSNLDKPHEPNNSVHATARTDANSMLAHQQLVDKAKQGRIDLYFVGDSITRRWGCTDPQYSDFLANWKKNFFGWNAGNFGWGGDTTENILWRLENGELAGVHPKVIVILAGTNNLSEHARRDAQAENVTHGIKAIVDVCQQKAPTATIIVTAILPRNDKTNLMPMIDQINENLKKLADGKKIRFLNVNDKLAGNDGKLIDGVTVDKLHLTAKGYQIWADGLKPILTELLGPPAMTDHAPPPTGDPSIRAAN